MWPTLRAAALALLIAIAAHAQFTLSIYIDGPRDAATNETGIAPGAMFIVKGYFPVTDGLRLAPLPLPTTFDGLSLSLVPNSNPAATPIRPFIYYTYRSQKSGDIQLAAILPSSTPPGDYVLRLTSGADSAASMATVLANKFRLLTNNQDGYGTAVAQDRSYNRVLFTSPARPGDALILWGLGLGAISGPDNVAPGPFDLRSQLNVRASIGGIDAPVSYAGRAPDSPGLDQVNITIPTGAPAGCNVAVEIIAAGQPSNPVTVPIAPAGADSCVHPNLTAAQLRELEQGRAFRTGQFHFMIYSEPYRDIPFVQIHSAIGFFNNYTAAHASVIAPSSVAPGRCVMFRGDPNGMGPGWASRLFLDAPVDDSYYAGDVTVSGGAIPSVPLNGDDDHYYRMFSAFREDNDAHVTGTAGRRFTAGATLLEGPGSSDVGAFQASIQMPALLVWTNRDTAKEVSRSSPLTLNWTGGSPLDPVFIQGASGDRSGVTTFICVAAAGSQNFTVPQSVMEILPQSPGFLRVAAFGPGVTFTASNAPGPNSLNYLFMTSVYTSFR